MIEAIKNERSLYREQSVELKNEISELKRTYSNSSLFIQQLKNQINEKNNRFDNQRIKVEQARLDIKRLLDNIKSMQLEKDKMEKDIQIHSNEINELMVIINDADTEVKGQEKKVSSIMNEHMLLNKQVITRNNELNQLYNDIKLQNTLLNRVKQEYSNLTVELKNSESVEQELIDQIDKANEKKEEFNAIKENIEDLQGQLIQEKLKVRSLTDELNRPINVHRWRKLKDTDPDTFAMIKHVAKLTKKVIHKNQMVQEKDVMIQEKEKLYDGLQKVISKQPNYENTNQLRMYNKTLREKRKKFKSINSDLKHYRNKVNELKYDIQKLTDDMKVIKLAYFAKKRRDKRLEKMKKPVMFSEFEIDSDIESKFNQLKAEVAQEQYSDLSSDDEDELNR